MLGAVSGCASSRTTGLQSETGASRRPDGSDQRVARPPTGIGVRAQPIEGTTPENLSRCDSDTPDREVSEFDTSGDDTPDVRKVFLRLGTLSDLRLVLICRESDINADGVKDVIRYYTDEGRPLYEEADRNFDGRMDELAFFENGRLARRETDVDYDGRIDTKVWFASGAMVRSERDLNGRSTPTEWRPDRWEYFEDSRMVRMGTDLDGDGSVDRWDRDEEYRRRLEQDQIQRERREAAEDGFAEENESSSNDDSNVDGASESAASEPS